MAETHFELVLQALKRFGLLLESDPRLPSVSSLIAGEPISASWWSHKSGHDIFHVLNQLADHHDVLFTKLVSGKVTLVHRPLWPEVLAIGLAREAWQMKELSKSALSLLKKLEKHGSLRTDEIDWPATADTKIGNVVRELEKKLLLHTDQLHTESGAHAKLLETWTTWAANSGIKPAGITADKAKKTLEQTLEQLNDQFGAKAKLPWIKVGA